MEPSSCATITEEEVAGLFDRGHDSLTTKDPAKVVDNYAEQSLLLPTVSNKPRYTREEKEDYFAHFLENDPTGEVTERLIHIDCNTAHDSGLYTFTYGTTGQQVEARYTFTYGYIDNEWKITSHHSSQLPEG